MTTTCLPIPVPVVHTVTRPDGVVLVIRRRIGRTAATVRRRASDHRSAVTISEHVLSEIDVPRDLHR